MVERTSTGGSFSVSPVPFLSTILSSYHLPELVMVVYKSSIYYHFYLNSLPMITIHYWPTSLARLDDESATHGKPALGDVDSAQELYHFVKEQT